LERTERVVAQGETSEAALAALQRALEGEEREPIFLRGCRGWRATLDRFLGALETGDLPAWQFMRGYYRGDDDKTQRVDLILAYAGISTQSQRAALLHFGNQAVEIAKLPPERQEDRSAELAASEARLPVIGRSVMRGGLGQGDAVVYVRMARIHRWRWAQIRCTIAMLAVERYRKSHGKWPESLEALVPAWLERVPVDPYDGRALRYRRVADGAVIYAVGPDLTDNGGELEGKTRKASPWRNKPSEWEGLDVGVRLWDVKHRRQPPKDVVR
jgi:hypothetical protein